MPPEIVSHIRRDDTSQTIFCQSNREHSLGVANLAKRFAEAFGMGGWGYALGLLHDKGKEKHQFQSYIRDVNGIPGYTDYTRDGKSHAYVGAILARRIYGTQALHLFCNQIASHHRGLYDYDELEEIISEPLPEEISEVTEKPNLDSPQFRLRGEDFHHLSRMLFSCLVDADFLDTEAFMNEANAMDRGSHNSLASLAPLLERHIDRLQQKAVVSDVNKIRKEI